MRIHSTLITTVRTIGVAGLPKVSLSPMIENNGRTRASTARPMMRGTLRVFFHEFVFMTSTLRSSAKVRIGSMMTLQKRSVASRRTRRVPR